MWDNTLSTKTVDKECPAIININLKKSCQEKSNTRMQQHTKSHWRS
jgi:hypothetical protein